MLIKKSKFCLNPNNQFLIKELEKLERECRSFGDKRMAFTYSKVF